MTLLPWIVMALALAGVVAVYGFADLEPYLTDDKLPVEFPSGVPHAETAGPAVQLYSGDDALLPASHGQPGGNGQCAENKRTGDA